MGRAQLRPPLEPFGSSQASCSGPALPCGQTAFQFQELSVPRSRADVLTVKRAFKISLLDNDLMFFQNTGAAKSFFFSPILL